MNYIQVMTTVASQQDAEKIARCIVDERLAACVQITSCRSFYRWKGKVADDSEYLLTIKSRSDLFPRLEEQITGLHAYEVPEILVTPIIDGAAPYLSWLEAKLLPAGA
ncbi:MAG: cytochrome C biogenesis protein CcdA [Desulfobulbus propionicus]|nr:MAG: cytochrome C biogenesis protein CcdA [Desulfobulbus propionicus]